eukprot:CAMPEP_0115242572 /NCGR_PEP_ID=MMETSP0270-20121206/39022_1 /TAXON_ID=71861 /ORGANISM="Scrippsiella trochoidea, Strain CCMP3099" /LENGTH=215 /DNA_ID=CAMNT_0002657643 /DNA_START=156 /DNA_END=803 /DNA_ORIENTATION=+
MIRRSVPAEIDVSFQRTAPTTWQRSHSAGDLVAQRRTPNRRPFDAAGHPEELLSPSSTIARLSDMTPLQADPSKRVRTLRYRGRTEDSELTMSEPASPCSPGSYGSRQERALDFWPLGESCRIMHHIQPKKYSRPISLHGEVYQGKYVFDWQGVDHIKKQRSRYPVGRQASLSLGPYPQGLTQEELMRNRCFDRSHGSERMPAGLMQVGSLLLVP